ncbi:S-formylglutathione hydrolase [Leeia oryzae]|uniref:S-formylglutathione hydrolase n=1 Tax=Leeia oryzae TaxID=356662 RepID=UPI000382C1F8|nr:S-formylglutathione hydrolase [Leeia oryzae]
MKANAIDTISAHKAFDGVQGFYSHESESCRGQMKFSVYQPPQATSGKVPVLVYLAGLTCTEETFMIKAGAQRLASELGMMLVAPDTSPRHAAVAGESDSWDFGVGAGFYVDATGHPWSAAYNMYSYVVKELPAILAEHFPAADLSRMGIFGHSMGGHGALTIGLKHPELFRSLSAFAPIVAPMTCPWGQKAFTGYLGTDQAQWKAYDACQLVQQSCFPGEILIDQGTADKFLVEQLKPELFVAACKTAGQSLNLRMHDGYDHGYYFISTFMEDHLRHHAKALGK